MKKISFNAFGLIFSLAFLFCCSAQVSAQSLSESDAFRLLQKTDAQTNFSDTDFAASYSIIQDKPGQGKTSREAVMYRRDSTSSYTILITGPQSDKGKGYLQIEDSIWFYDPADSQFVYSSAKDKFEGTNINQADLAPQHFSTDYRIVSAEKVKLGSLNCVLFNLEAKVNDVPYPSVKIWVTEDDGLLRKKEDYSLSGQLLRTTAIPSYQKFGSRSVPEKMLIVDNLRGRKINDKMQYEKTQVTITNVSFAKQSDSVYTKKYIESMAQ